jgi:hypothetical protein
MEIGTNSNFGKYTRGKNWGYDNLRTSGKFLDETSLPKTTYMYCFALSNICQNLSSVNGIIIPLLLCRHSLVISKTLTKLDFNSLWFQRPFLASDLCIPRETQLEHEIQHP